MKNEEMFSMLVENGLDFLFKAISEFKEQPKYSVIHFHAAVELVIKARLFHEHWTLVITQKQVPDWDKFIKGDFQSVSLEDAAILLSKTVRSGLSESEIKAFKEVAKHRNKMVHFFHEAHTDKENKELKRDIAKLQLKAWYFLHYLLTSQWKDVFSDWKFEIDKIEDALKEHHEFLQVVFDNLKPEIENLKNKGVQIEKCPSCEFVAQKHDDETKAIYESKCLVCGLGEKCLKIECPECSRIVFFKNEGVATCSCGEFFEPEDVAEVLIDEGAALYAFKDGGDDSFGIGNCNECDGYHTVALTENNEWVCASCFREFESLDYCQWCNEPNTGDMEHSMFDGCNHCDGRRGRIRDD
jgi:hypothetical protein